MVIFNSGETLGPYSFWFGKGGVEFSLMSFFSPTQKTIDDITLLLCQVIDLEMWFLKSG